MVQMLGYVIYLGCQMKNKRQILNEDVDAPCEIVTPDEYWVPLIYLT